MTYDESMRFDAIMLQFLAMQTTQNHEASPSINLSTSPTRLMRLLNHMNTCNRFRAVIMLVFSFASNKNYRFCVQSFKSFS